MSRIGEVLETARRAQGMTQEELAEVAGLTQATLSRYEHGLRTPQPDDLKRLAEALGVTVSLLERGDRMQGGIAVTAHMRRRATANVTVWRSLEAKLNMLRLHAAKLSEEIIFRSELQVPIFDPLEDAPEEAARLVRTQWRMPVGPIYSLVDWMEAAGVLVFEEDFGQGARVDGLSQWAGDHPIMLINSSVPRDRKRLTLAHELGHLVLHADILDGDLESQANAFAAELLMPTREIKPMLQGHLTLARLLELKRYWGVSIAALIERAWRLERITREQRTSLYKQLSARRWRTTEPGSEDIPLESPRLPSHIADSLEAKGLTTSEIATILGFDSPSRNTVFRPSTRQGLRVV